MPLVKQIDLLDYSRGPYANEGRCRVRLYETVDGAPTPYLAVATDLGDKNPGPSVTNAADLVAESVCERFNLSPDQVTFVEHYDGRIGNTSSLNPRDGVEDYDLVVFQTDRRPLTQPAWRPMRKHQVEALVGEPLP